MTDKDLRLEEIYSDLLLAISNLVNVVEPYLKNEKTFETFTVMLNQTKRSKNKNRTNLMKSMAEMFLRVYDKWKSGFDEETFDWLLKNEVNLDLAGESSCRIPLSKLYYDLMKKDSDDTIEIEIWLTKCILQSCRLEGRKKDIPLLEKLCQQYVPVEPPKPVQGPKVDHGAIVDKLFKKVESKMPRDGITKENAMSNMQGIFEELLKDPDIMGIMKELESGNVNPMEMLGGVFSSLQNKFMSGK